MGTVARERAIAGCKENTKENDTEFPLAIKAGPNT
jgi:hypothetical protein